MSDVLSARAAAEIAGVDERTVRRWVKSGHLAADKRGGRFLIDRSALEPFIGQTNGHERTAAAERTERTVDDASVNLELVRLVDRLQRDNQVLAGRIGWLEAQVEQLKALPSGVPVVASGDPSDDEQPEIGPETGVPRRTWWKRAWQALAWTS